MKYAVWLHADACRLGLGDFWKYDFLLLVEPDVTDEGDVERNDKKRWD